jgi:putative oxidoreductase
MSASSQTVDHVTGPESESAGSTRARGVAPAYSPTSALYDVVATGRALGTVARLTLGLVMLPHALQKAFGWFGGYGLAGTYHYFTTNVGLPGVIAGIAITLEIVGALLLVTGAFTRFGAAAILGVMVGAVVTTHLSHGFFMNWAGVATGGEGFEYHILAIGLAIVTIISGGGGLSIDRLLTKRLRPGVDPVAGHFMGGDNP